MENEILSIVIRYNISDDSSKKEKINELKGLLDKKGMEAEQWNITIASVEAFANILLKDEKKNEK